MASERDVAWNVGDIDYPNGDPNVDGSGWLLELYVREFEAYVEYVERYYEKQVNPNLIQRLYGLEPLSPEIVTALNAEADVEAVLREAEKIGYPLA